MSQDPFDLVGDVIDGQFRVDAFVGEGDLSVVYKGYHTGVDAPVAIKCLNLPATLDPALVRPLIESFREGSRLHYRLARGNLNIAQSIASGTTLASRTGQLVPFLVREWFEGRSLAEYFARRRAEGLAGLPFEEARALLDPVADGIAYAHRQGVAHHSINPSNLFVVEREPRPTVKILDFGVARVLNEGVLGPTQPAAARVGLRVLLPGYAAPEQLDAQIGALGPWTDVYSFALVFLETLLGRPVFAGGEAVPAAHLDATNRPSPRKLGLRLRGEANEVLERALSLDPSRRPPSAEAFWTALEKAAPRRSVANPSAIGQRPPAPLVTAPLPSVTLPLASPFVRSPTGNGPDGGTGGPIARPAALARPHEVHPVPAPPSKAFSASDELPTLKIETIEGTHPTSQKAAAAQPPSLPLADVRSLEPLDDVGGVGAVRSGRARRAAASALAITVLGVVAWLFHRAVAPDAHARPAPAASVAPASTAPAVAPFAPPVTPALAAAASPAASSPALDAPLAPLTSRGSAATVGLPPHAIDESSPRQAAHSPAKRFTRGLAVPSLDAIAAHLLTCRRRGEPWGPGSIRITFDSSGREVHITIGPPYRGTREGACIVERFRRARVQAFRGSFGAVNYVYVLPK